MFERTWRFSFLAVALTVGACTPYDNSLPGGDSSSSTGGGTRGSIGSSSTLTGSTVPAGSSGSGDSTQGTTQGTGGFASEDGSIDGPTAGDAGAAGSSPSDGSPDLRVGDAADAGRTVDSPIGPTTESMIDNMEDNNVPHYILPVEGRVGYWFTVNDGADGGTQTPAPSMFGMSPGGYNGPYAAHLSGHGFSVWGIYMGFTLNKPLQGVRNTYDASAYTGISFWAKLGATNMCSPPSSCRLVHVAISTRDTDAQGGVCKTACSDHFGSWIDLTAEWHKYTILFRNMMQDGWGIPGPAQGLKFDAAHTYEVQFQVKPAAAPFDFWIDDVAFVLP
ncbi:MAG TPA: hypothetical protein VF881_19755 [Polyangiaceae bacterium]